MYVPLGFAAYVVLMLLWALSAVDWHRDE